MLILYVYWDTEWTKIFCVQEISKSVLWRAWDPGRIKTVQISGDRQHIWCCYLQRIKITISTAQPCKWMCTKLCLKTSTLLLSILNVPFMNLIISLVFVYNIIVYEYDIFCKYKYSFMVAIDHVTLLPEASSIALNDDQWQGSWSPDLFWSVHYNGIITDTL